MRSWAFAQRAPKSCPRCALTLDAAGDGHPSNHPPAAASSLLHDHIHPSTYVLATPQATLRAPSSTNALPRLSHHSTPPSPSPTLLDMPALATASEMHMLEKRQSGYCRDAFGRIYRCNRGLGTGGRAGVGESSDEARGETGSAEAREGATCDALAALWPACVASCSVRLRMNSTSTSAKGWTARSRRCSLLQTCDAPPLTRLPARSLLTLCLQVLPSPSSSSSSS